MIDAGISCRQLTQRIKETGMQPEDLDGVLLTHEHRDISAACRYSAVNTTCRCLPTNQPGAVFRSAAKWNAAAAVFCKCLETEGLKIENFAVPHDAAGAVGYVFSYAGARCVYLTDVALLRKKLK